MTKGPIENPPIDAVRVLSALPVGVFITDAAGKITWVNDTVCNHFGVAREQLIGRERNALPAKKPLSLSKTVEWLHAPGAAGAPDRRLECITQKIDEGPTFEGSIGCVVDVSRYEVVKRPRQLYPELKDPSKLDPSTGLLNSATMQQELISQVSRSRRYHNPLSVVLIRLQDTTSHSEAVAAIQKQRLSRGIARMLKEKLRWVDVVGCWDKDAFMLILPETALESASKLVRKIDSYITRLKQDEERVGDSTVNVTIGLAEWGKGDDIHTLIARVEASAKGEGANAVGRANPSGA